MPARLAAAPFGRLPDGRAASLHTLENGRLRVRITDFGARMVSIEAPDRDGRSGHVLLGLDDAASYATLEDLMAANEGIEDDCKESLGMPSADDDEEGPPANEEDIPQDE